MIRIQEGDVVAGETLQPALNKETQLAIEHLNETDSAEPAEAEPPLTDGGAQELVNDRGETLREEIARKVEEEPEDLEEFLRDGHEYTRRENLVEFVDAVESSETLEKPDSYDKIILRPKGNQYHRSKRLLESY